MTDFSALRSQIAGTIILPSDHGFSLTIKGAWNGLLRDRKPMAFVKVKTTEDVVETLKFCVKNELDICLSCGGTSDFAIVNDAVVIDLSQLNKVLIDPESKTVVVGGGAKLCEVDKATAQQGLVIPLGSYPLLGMAGMTLIGGIGYLTPSYGCTSDNIMEYELVTVNGDIIKASNEENQELFWGMKGQGANFGIVTTMKFKLHAMPCWIVGGSLKYSLPEAKEKLKAVRDFYIKREDQRLCLYMMLHLKASGWEVEVRLLFNGPVSEGGQLVEDLQDCTFPRQNTCGAVHHCDFQSDGENCFRREKYNYSTAGHFLTDLNDDVISNLVDATNNVPHESYREFADTTIYMNTLGGKMNEIEEDSSFPFRSARFWIGASGACRNKEQYAELKKWLDEVQEVNKAFGELPFGEKADEANARLIALKREYDHHNININPQ